MKINQVFQKLSIASDPRIAKMILREVVRENYNPFWVWKTARKLKRGVPPAKIIGKKWFYGLEFKTNKYTLDPRPDSETLVAAILAENPKNILDLGTGTGCLLCAILKNMPNAKGVGIDVSRGALRVAKYNVRNLGLSNRAKIKRGNFFKSQITSQKSRFDTIISNPPYIANKDSRVNLGATFDPKIALYAKDNGLAAYVAIAKNAKKWIKPNGKIYLEIGMGQGDAVRKIFEEQEWKFVAIHTDLSGTDRVLIFHYILIENKKI